MVKSSSGQRITKLNVFIVDRYLWDIVLLKIQMSILSNLERKLNGIHPTYCSWVWIVLKSINHLKKIADQPEDDILQLGSCPLHTTHNAFRNGTFELNFDFDQFAIDAHSLSELLSARREDYSSMRQITEPLTEYTLKHMPACCLTLKYVTVRLLDPWDNLSEYYLKYLPGQSYFKYVIKETLRYKRIKEVLKDSILQSYLALLAFAGHVFEGFLVKFQSVFGDFQP